MLLKLIIILPIFITLSFGRQTFINDFCKYDSSAHGFIVLNTIEVFPDDTMNLLYGNNLFFAPFTGIYVKGNLVSQGNPSKPVNLSSLKYLKGKGSPYDWAGIRVFQGASCDISYSRISFSSFGIESCCENVSLIDVSFLKNGTQLKIGSRSLQVNDNIPYSMNKDSDSVFVDDINLDIPVRIPVSNKYDEIINNRYIPNRTWVLGVLSTSLFVVGSIISIESFGNINKKEVFNSKSQQFLFCGPFGYCLMGLGLASGTYTTIYTINY